MEGQSRKLDGIVILLVAAVGFIVSAVSFFWRQQGLMSTLVFCEEGVFYLLVFYYGLRGFRKPHGNMARYLMLLLAAVTAASILMQLDAQIVPWQVVLSSNLAAVFMGYMAGRLHKTKTNRYLGIFVTLLLLVRCFWPMEHQDPYGIVGFFYVLDRCTALFTWLTIVLVYFFRFREHKQAGLAADAQTDA